MNIVWLAIILAAYLFYAIVFIIDKRILSQLLPNPVVYAFYVGFLGIFVLALIPFGFSMPSGSEVFLSLLAGVFQIFGFLLFYKAIHRGEVSRIVPFTGALTAVFVMILSSLTIKEFLTSQQFLAFVFLILGGLVISFKKGECFKNSPFILALFASLFFAAFWVITKYIFLGTNFVSGLIWVRIGVALIALTLLFSKKNRELIFSKTRETKPKIAGLFMLGRIINVAGSLFLYWAVFLGSVSLASAFQGIQYVFVLILALLLFRKIPSLKEQFNQEFLFQKIVSVSLICLGLVILVI